MNGRHDHTTAVCISLRWSGSLRVYCSMLDTILNSVVWVPLCAWHLSECLRWNSIWITGMMRKCLSSHFTVVWCVSCHGVISIMRWCLDFWYEVKMLKLELCSGVMYVASQSKLCCDVVWMFSIKWRCSEFNFAVVWCMWRHRVNCSVRMGLNFWHGMKMFWIHLCSCLMYVASQSNL